MSLAIIPLLGHCSKGIFNKEEGKGMEGKETTKTYLNIFKIFKHSFVH